MPRVAAFMFIALSAFLLALAQNSDPYKPTLDHLESLIHQPKAEWRTHEGIPHPENPSLTDSNWITITVKNGSRQTNPNTNSSHKRERFFPQDDNIL